jgi:hypothetical protein
VVRLVRSDWLFLAEGHLSQRLFGNMLRMIAALPLRTVSEQGRKANEGSEAIEPGSVSGEEDWSMQDPHSGSAERPKRAALPPQRGQDDLRLTLRGRRARLSG